jgi:hypothetical protein
MLSVISRLQAQMVPLGRSLPGLDPLVVLVHLPQDRRRYRSRRP